MSTLLFRICDAADWNEGGRDVPLSGLDRSDGFLHLSTASQVAGTLRRFFAGRADLVLLTIDRATITAGALRFELATDGGPERFPHVYAAIPRAAVVRVDQLQLRQDGNHELPNSLTRELVGG